MTQKKLMLRQVQDHTHTGSHEKLKEAEEGDVVDGFKVVSSEDVPCNHENRRWRIDKDCDTEPPIIDGRCQVCGDVKRVNPEEE